MHLFDINGPLMDVLRKLSDIILYNLLFVIFSLPLFTCGAAFCALCHGMQVLAADGNIEQGVLKTFWEDFKSRFGESTKLFAMAVFPGLLLFAAIATKDYMPKLLGDFYLLSVFVIVGVASLGLQFAFPLLAKDKCAAKQAMMTSLKMSVAQFPWALCSLGVTVGFVYLTMFMRENAFFYGTFYWVCAGFGVLVYINSFWFLKAYTNIFDKTKE